MGIINFSEKIKHNKGSICFAIFLYWVLLLIWQNIAGAVNRGITDTAVKFLLFIFLIASFLIKPGRSNKNNIFVIILFLITQAATFFLTDLKVFNSGILITYIFPVVFVFLSLCYGEKFCVEADEINRINRYIRIVIDISIIYTLVFEPSQYVNALRSTKAYGSELHSFFASMHEYAIYLFYCITTLLREINDSNRGKITGNIPVKFFLLIVYSLTLVLTFSRTAIGGCIVFLLIYSLLNKGTKLSKNILWFLFLGVLIVFLVLPIRNYAFDIVWKGGNVRSRERLTEYALLMFKNGSMLQKMFGHGVIATRSIFSDELGYGAIHNAFLQILLYYGIVGLIFLMGFMVHELIAIGKFIKIYRIVGIVYRDAGTIGLAYLVFTTLIMFTNTFIIFFSSIDCFFITAMFILIPKYERNGLLEKVNGRL